jgi:beta-lactamase regulating signal transducer with metallopeptidase domain
MTCGVRHPAIVFPPDAPDWPEDDLNRAIVHELEHVWRRDWIWHCLARTVCAVYWFHPLVWIAARRLAVEAERACDDAVLGRSDATAYADQLIELARRLSAARKSPALAMANRSDLSTRIGALLDAQQRRGRAGRMLLALAGVAAVIGVAMSPLRIIAAQNTGKFEVASIRLEDPHDPRSAPANTNSPEFRSQMTVFPSSPCGIPCSGA